MDREKLLDFSGRSRKPQIRLAAHYGLTDYAQPAGGCCFLTDPQYSVKLKDLWGNRGDRDYDLDDLMLLKVGRHFRPAPHFKLIIAREEGEGRFLYGYRKRFVSLRPISHPGPEALLDGSATEEDLRLAARLIARYSRGRDSHQVRLQVERPDGSSCELTVRPFAPRDIPGNWLL